MKDAKYLFAYITPLAAFLGLYFGGIWSLGSVYIGFLIIPIFEFLLPQSTANLSVEEENSKAQSFFFDFLLYLNIPIVYAILSYFFQILTQGGSSTFEQIGMVLNMGLLLGPMGINIAPQFIPTF